MENAKCKAGEFAERMFKGEKLNVEEEKILLDSNSLLHSLLFLTVPPEKKEMIERLHQIMHEHMESYKAAFESADSDKFLTAMCLAAERFLSLPPEKTPAVIMASIFLTLGECLVGRLVAAPDIAITAIAMEGVLLRLKEILARQRN